MCSDSRAGRRCLIAAIVVCLVVWWGQVLAAGNTDSPAPPPEEVRQVFDAYLKHLTDGDATALRKLLCFVDERDEELFGLFGPRGGGVDPGLFPSGKPVEFMEASDDCWLVVLDRGQLVELLRADDTWRVLCPTSGRTLVARAKMTRAEACRFLLSEQMEQVRGESEAQLEQRRARYLAVLDLSQRHRLQRLFPRYSGIPTDDAEALAKMPLRDFRDAVILKLDAPNGLRYRVQPDGEAFVEGEPVLATFLVENVTGAPVRLKYRPSVEVIDSSNAITARGAVVPPKGFDSERAESPLRSAFSRPFKETELEIKPGETWKMRIDLRDYYLLPASQYSVSAHLNEPRDDQDSYWHGTANTDTVRFEVKPAAGENGG